MARRNINFFDNRTPKEKVQDAVKEFVDDKKEIISILFEMIDDWKTQVNENRTEMGAQLESTLKKVIKVLPIRQIELKKILGYDKEIARPILDGYAWLVLASHYEEMGKQMKKQLQSYEAEASKSMSLATKGMKEKHEIKLKKLHDDCEKNLGYLTEFYNETVKIYGVGSRERNKIIGKNFDYARGFIIESFGAEYEAKAQNLLSFHNNKMYPKYRKIEKCRPEIFVSKFEEIESKVSVNENDVTSQEKSSMDKK